MRLDILAQPAEKYLQGVGNRHQHSRYRRHFLQRKFSGLFVTRLTFYLVVFHCFSTHFLSNATFIYAFIIHSLFSVRDNFKL
jgi:hypothetical protein